MDEGREKLSMKVVALILIAAVAAGGTSVVKEHVRSSGSKGSPAIAAVSVNASVSKGSSAALLGSPDFRPSPERPVGWRGDWTGRFPGATPPMQWSRRVKGITSEIHYSAKKPVGASVGDSHSLEYFTIKDWLVAGPFLVDDPVKGIERDLLGGETAVTPDLNAKAGALTWKFLRADIETQSRHECNGGTCGELNVDFVYAFGNMTQVDPSKIGYLSDPKGDLVNKVAYAHTYLYSPKEEQVGLCLQMAGAASRFWLNGKPIDLGPHTSGNITLASGWNRLLVKLSTSKGVVKIEDGNNMSGWRFAAYITPKAPFAYDSTNIAWMTKMTGRSMSQPIVVGDPSTGSGQGRIFIGSGISDLLCIDKRNGKILWLKSTSPYDAMTADEKKAIPAFKEKIEPLLAQLERLNEEVVKGINAAVSPQGLPSEQATAMDQKIKEKYEFERNIHNSLDRKKYPPYYANEVSSSNPTPCSDGTHVYWACGGGMQGPGANAIACFDLDGKRIWTYHEAFGAVEHGTHTSPALADGKVIYGANQSLIALDARTGSVVWTKRGANRDDVLFFGGNSPVIARVGNETVVVGNRAIFRVADGTGVCGSNLNDVNAVYTPIIDDGIVYNQCSWRGWTEHGGVVAVKLPANTQKGAQAAVLWDPPGKDVAVPERGFNAFIASPLCVNGTYYSVTMGGAMTAVDVNAKKALYRLWLDGYTRYNRFVYGVAASPTLGGKNIYIVDDAGYTHIIQPGTTFKEVGHNVLENIHQSGQGGNPCKQESFYTAPWFDGNAMYLRGEEYLYCIREK